MEKEGGDIVFNPSAPEVAPQDKRDLVSVTPDDLVGFLRDDQTSIQSSRVVEPFIGKWIQVEGKLRDVHSSSDDSAGVFFERDIKGVHLYMRFTGKESVDRLLVLKKGTSIVIQGQIESVSKIGVGLENCELIQ